MMKVINAIRSRKPQTTIMPGAIQVFLYKDKEFKIFSDSDITCEKICIECCISLKILPTTRLLFGLRKLDSEEWLFPCQIPERSDKYEFRMRFKVPDLDNLSTIDPNAYEYLYHQIRHDMFHERIDEIRYPLHKNNVLGLGVVDMYIDLAEKKGSVESIEKNYKKYVPPIILQTHQIFARKRILEGFENLRKTTKGLNYVKSSYMHTLADLAPNYLREKYNATVANFPEGGDQLDRSNNYPVSVDLDLFGDEGPSIKVSLFKKQWLLVTKLENLNALYLDENQLGVELDINGHLRKYHLKFNHPHESKSFMTYVTGYLRLSIKWMFDPCVNFPTPSLMELKELKCHGPVGGDFSYAQIRESGKGRGTFIVRQCEKEYDTYYIDIVAKKKHPETFKITKIDNEWLLHMDEVSKFANLNDLADHIPADIKFRYQIPASDYDKPQLLLLCVSRNLLPKTTGNEITLERLQENRPQIFEPKRDLQRYIHSETRSDCGRMTCHLAEWIQKSGIKNIKVTLKMLNNESDFGAFMELSNTWSGIYSADFLKMYGLTLTAPYAVIVEHSKYGPLNRFLSTRRNVSFRCLLELANGLVRAVAFMQEKRIYHGRIRCSSLMVTSYCPEKNVIVAKLADFGIRREYDKNRDLPWIPSTFYSNLSNKQLYDLSSELWAFATTMWEIFSRGEPIQGLTVKQLTYTQRETGGILEIPREWHDDIRDIIMNGWSINEIRFDKMNILRKLNKLIKKDEALCSEISQPFTDDDIEPSTNSTSSNETGNICDDEEDAAMFSDMLEMATVQRITQGKLIRKVKIGEGHYGVVYRGEIEYHNETRREVAIKVLKNSDGGCIGEDFNREIDIMQGLNHPNIVRIIMFTEQPMSIVMEYLMGGSFEVYLLSRKPILTNEKLLNFSLQIAEGMAYLSEKGIIHRDLAARNILVDGEIVKISDFGLAQHVNTNGYYITQKNRKIPYKWYAVESLISNKFSASSDVWSYGVTLFEIFSRGEEPYLEGLKKNTPLMDLEFVAKLKEGERLKKPDLCPQIVYDQIMKPSWHAEKEKRPTFKQIIKIIKSIQNSNEDLI
ncbi:tyrosine-protein kinase hopscotch [Eupeodes corollae]|uniref:tyrosine-protein kinase hopscotch n=1 Tax=Eupeodes corollae TaxID=290404 RepID=UPI0024937FDB|nr:tyrosine-protein kinase hopscotch [Eupeodes corollae]